MNKMLSKSLRINVTSCVQRDEFVFSFASCKTRRLEYISWHLLEKRSIRVWEERFLSAKVAIIYSQFTYTVLLCMINVNYQLVYEKDLCASAFLVVDVSYYGITYFLPYLLICINKTEMRFFFTLDYMRNMYTLAKGRITNALVRELLYVYIYSSCACIINKRLPFYFVKLHCISLHRIIAIVVFCVFLFICTTRCLSAQWIVIICTLYVWIIDI